MKYWNIIKAATPVIGWLTLLGACVIYTLLTRNDNFLGVLSGVGDIIVGLASFCGIIMLITSLIDLSDAVSEFGIPQNAIKVHFHKEESRGVIGINSFGKICVLHNKYDCSHVKVHQKWWCEIAVDKDTYLIVIPIEKIKEKKEKTHKPFRTLNKMK